VLGVVEGESDQSPEKTSSRTLAYRDRADAGLVEQRVWACVEERFSDDWPSRPGTKWRVPECDIMELPEGYE